MGGESPTSTQALAAWMEFLAFGLPRIPAVPQIYPSNFAGPHGFPLWVRYCHFFDFLFVTMLIRSGLSILVDHPRLYFNNDCSREASGFGSRRLSCRQIGFGPQKMMLATSRPSLPHRVTGILWAVKCEDSQTSKRQARV
jgi:hypothetical protein